MKRIAGSNMLRWLSILLFIAINLCAILYAATHFLISTADQPIAIELASCAPAIIAKAIGHAKHLGIVDMQNYLIPPFFLLSGIIVIDVLVVIILAVKRRS